LVGADDARDFGLAVETLHRCGIGAMPNLLQDRFPLSHASAGKGKPEAIGVLVPGHHDVEDR
jgi:hypothetical protein